ncbi:hypothetical protein LJC64_01595 [Ruminococcaceae bacterium OttesenSCG-928-A11]|nr:hypothetical protein [Ruminococcaceae bacterium OttesenSCG-928-A11]
MELSMRMLTAREITLAKNSDINKSEKPVPNTEITRKIDLYFVSSKRPRGKYCNGWVSISPEELLAEKYKDSVEPDTMIFCMEYPYYLCGICYKIYDSPADTIGRRQCIELRIDGKDVVLETGEKSLFVVDRHKGIRYELTDSFKSMITPGKSS